MALLSAVEAIHGYLESRTDLSHALVTQTTKTLNQDSHGDALDRVQIHGTAPGYRVVVGF